MKLIPFFLFEFFFVHLLAGQPRLAHLLFTLRQCLFVQMQTAYFLVVQVDFLQRPFLLFYSESSIADLVKALVEVLALFWLRLLFLHAVVFVFLGRLPFTQKVKGHMLSRRLH